MKIRQGFVSNSSSSSFCIYGICTAESSIIDVLIEKGVPEEELADGIGEYLYEYSYARKKREGTLTVEEIDKNEKKFFKAEDGFESHNPYYDCGESIYLGIDWSTIGDDETGSEFKTRIEDTLKDLLGDDTQCFTYKKAWRDG